MGADKPVPVRRVPAMQGAPPKNPRMFIDRQRPILAARWVRACRRALHYLNDPDVKIDYDWIRLFNSLADRLGAPRMVLKGVEVQTTTLHLNPAGAEVAIDAHTEDRLQGLQERIRLLEGAEGTQKASGE